MEAVPNCCVKKNNDSILNTIITTVLLPSSIPNEGSSFNPSIAEVIEMGGVIIPSANNEAPPIMAGITSHFFLRLTRANNAKVPPSPRLSAFKTRITYLIVVCSVIVQIIQESVPKIRSSVITLPFIISLNT